MFAISFYYKYDEILKTIYCRTEEKAKDFLRAALATDWVNERECYDDDLTFDELFDFAWEDGGIDGLIKIEEITFEEDK